MAGQPSETILVVDDNEANRALAEGTLADEGYRVVVASGGAEGVAKFEHERPDCVLLDVRMPDIDGFVACRRIRALPGGASTPVLFLTALRDVDTFDEALRVGGDDFLTKPVRPTELVVRVKTALELRRLGAEVRAHLATLKQQRDALMRVQLQKERLMAFVVHDLKNPVNAMDLHAQLLLRDRSLPPSARDSVTHIRNDARQLSRMIMNLLDLSKGDEGRLEAKCVSLDLPSLVHAVVGELDVTARAHKTTIEIGDLVPSVRGDDDLLRRMLANLIENAIRHSPSEATVRVSAREHDGGVELRVVDKGLGVPAEMRERIFEPFVQMEGGERPPSRSGRGLGLAFCRLAANAHGARIWVEDAAPGSTFCVWLPP